MAGGDEPVIVVAAELLPSQVATLVPRRVAGIITERGGAAGHAAILARSMGIPMVAGIAHLLREVRNGDLLALDGREGCVYMNPEIEVWTNEKRQQSTRVALQDALAGDARKDCMTADGVRVELLANVSGPAEAALAARIGAAGIGLYRTEYLFLAHPAVPSEEEQLAAYRDVLDAAPNHCAVFRTIDLGEDKYLPLLGLPPEENPAHPELLQTQLRAILQAAGESKVSLLFPMVTSHVEVRRGKELMNQARRLLRDRGITGDSRVPVGAMIEIPAAALCVEHLLDEVDFVNIGTNDLIQYLVAADRNSPRMAPWCEPFSPALYRLLVAVVKTCADRGKPVTLCGEMASRPVCLLSLLGMGVRSLSMSPILIPTVRELARHATLAKAVEVLERVLRMKTSQEIQRYLSATLEATWPEAALLDVQEAAEVEQASPTARQSFPARTHAR